MTLVLIQMHGAPGSGKSTFARALAPKLPALVIDKDVIASALIRHGVPFGEAGAPSYQVMYAQATRFLEDGHSIIMDSPCSWPRIEATTRGIAAAAGAVWLMIECTCSDEVRDERLRRRPRLESNPTARVQGLPPGTYEPSCERLTLDASQPLEGLVEAALDWVHTQVGLLSPAESSAVGRGAGGEGLALATGGLL